MQHTIAATGGAGIQRQIKPTCDHFLGSCGGQRFQQNHFVTMDFPSHIGKENHISRQQFRKSSEMRWVIMACNHKIRFVAGTVVMARRFLEFFITPIRQNRQLQFQYRNRNDANAVIYKTSWKSLF